MELGSLYHRRGDLSTALKSYLKARDFCSSPRQALDANLAVIVVAFDSSNMIQVWARVKARFLALV
jgi:hypothetical protein